MNDPTQPNRTLRWAQWLLIWIAIGLGAGRILSAEKPDAKSPLFSANDRSRWATVLALVEHRRFEIDDIIKANGKRTKFHTIDLVQHRARDGRQHYYSSKPPFLPVLVSVQYVFLHAAGYSLQVDTSLVVRTLLLTTNLLPFLLYLLAIRHLANQLTTNEMSRLFLIAAAGFATLLSPFLITLNNHLPAAIAVAITMVLVMEIVRRSPPPWWLFPPAGLFAAFAVTNELPALAFLAIVGVVLAIKSISRTMLGFAPMVVVVAAVYFGLNFYAHEDWVPPYGHRRDGAEIGRIESPPDELLVGRLGSAEAELLVPVVGEAARDGADCFRAGPDRWSIELRTTHTRYALLNDERPGWSVREWNNWYDYPGSYWQSDKQGVDRGEPSRATYTFHALIGHHGVFSLTPIWLISLLGAALMLTQGGDRTKLAFFVLGLSVIVIGFYIARPEIDRNYGGVSCGFRWSFWLIPLWLIVMAPGLDWLNRRRWGVGLALMLLAISVASANFAASNPWRHPWLFEFLDTIGWIHYP